MTLESSEIARAFLPLLVQRRHVARGPQGSAPAPPPPNSLKKCSPVALFSVDFIKDFIKDCDGYIKFIIVDFILASLKSEKFSWLWL